MLQIKSGSTLLFMCYITEVRLDQASPKNRCTPSKGKDHCQPGRLSFTCSQEDHPRQGCVWWDAEYCARTVGHRKMSQVSKWSAQWDEFIGTKISSIWTFKICRMAKTFNHSAPPFNPTIQRRTIGHREMSQVSRWSAWWDEVIGTKISPTWMFKTCRTAKTFDHSAPPFNPTIQRR